MGTGVRYIRVCRVLDPPVFPDARLSRTDATGCRTRGDRLSRPTRPVVAPARARRRGSRPVRPKSERTGTRLLLAQATRFGHAHGIADGDPDVTGFDPGLECLCGGARTQGAQGQVGVQGGRTRLAEDRKSTRLNSSHVS